MPWLSHLFEMQKYWGTECSQYLCITLYIVAIKSSKTSSNYDVTFSNSRRISSSSSTWTYLFAVMLKFEWPAIRWRTFKFIPFRTIEEQHVWRQEWGVKDKFFPSRSWFIFLNALLNQWSQSAAHVGVPLLVRKMKSEYSGFFTHARLAIAREKAS